MDRIDSAQAQGHPSDLSINEPENPLRHYAGILRRRARWTVIAVAVGLILGFISGFLIKPAKITVRYYKAVNTLTATNDTQSSGNYTLPRAQQLVQDKDLIDQVAKKVGWDAETTGYHLAAQVRGDQYALDVVGIAKDPKTAELLANTAASVLADMADVASQANYQADRERLVEQRKLLLAQQETLRATPDNQAQLALVQNQLATVESQLATLGASPPRLGLTTSNPASAIEINEEGYEQRLDNATNLAGRISPNNSIVSPDQAIDETDLDRPSVPGRFQLLFFGGVIGLVIGIILSFIIEAWDDRIRSRARVEDLCDLPVLAEIPNLTNEETATNAVAMVDSPKSPTAERYRATCTSTLFAIGETATERPDDVPEENRNGIRHREGHTPVILITSPGPGEGKTTTSANVAAAFADTGRRVLTVDADYRRPALAKFLAPVPSLIDPDGPSSTRIDDVSFLAAQIDSTAVGDAVFQLRRLIEQHRNDFDVVVVDTPPMLTTNDATDLLTVADVTILVVRAGHTRTTAAQRAATVLSRLRADVLGVVLNGCDRKEMENYYGYGYGSGYGYGDSYSYYGSTSPKKKRGKRAKTARPGTNGATAPESVTAEHQVRH